MSLFGRKNKGAELKPSASPKKGRVRSTILLTMVFVFFLGAGWAAGAAADLKMTMDKFVGMRNDDQNNMEAVPGTLPNRINVLIIGSDTRSGERARSDVLMVASIDQSTGRAVFLSIPRDTRVQIPGRGYAKVNAAYAYGGAKLTRQVVEPLVGVDIPYFVATDFNGFKNMIDILGGINVEVPRNMYKPAEEINLKAGVQRLNGKDALAFVRFRDMPLGDIDRVKNQKAFLLAVAEETMQVKTIAKLPQLIPQIENCIQTNFTGGQILELATIGTKKVNMDEVVVTMMPGDFLDLNGASYWQIRDSLANGLLAKLMVPGAQAPEWSPSKSVVNSPLKNAAAAKNTTNTPAKTTTPPSTTTDNKTDTGDKDETGDGKTDKDGKQTSGSTSNTNTGTGKDATKEGKQDNGNTQTGNTDKNNSSTSNNKGETNSSTNTNNTTDKNTTSGGNKTDNPTTSTDKSKTAETTSGGAKSG